MHYALRLIAIIGGGDYHELGSHAAAYPEFAKRVEAVISGDVESFITRITRAPVKDRKDESSGAADNETGGLERQ